LSLHDALPIYLYYNLLNRPARSMPYTRSVGVVREEDKKAFPRGMINCFPGCVQKHNIVLVVIRLHYACILKTRDAHALSTPDNVLNVCIFPVCFVLRLRPLPGDVFLYQDNELAWNQI